MVKTIPLSRRETPNQKRASQTLALILETTAILLEETGFEGLSTNQICKRADISPPALYRYYPNKFAILKELGENLMAAQNELVKDRLNKLLDTTDYEASYAEIMWATYEVTKAQKGGEWIMRSLHSTPALCDVRLNSHKAVSEQVIAFFASHYPKVDMQALRIAVRMNIEMGYGVLEYLFDHPDADKAAVIDYASKALSSQIRLILKDSLKS